MSGVKIYPKYTNWTYNLMASTRTMRNLNCSLDFEQHMMKQIQVYTHTIKTKCIEKTTQCELKILYPKDKYLSSVASNCTHIPTTGQQNLQNLLISYTICLILP